MQDPVLDLFELSLVGSALDHQLLPLGFQVGALLRDDDAQELVAQPLLCDHEVEERDFDSRLWQVVGVAERRGDIEAEVFAELHGGVAHAYVVDTPLPEDLLQEQRLKARVQLLADVLQEDRKAKLGRGEVCERGAARGAERGSRNSR